MDALLDTLWEHLAAGFVFAGDSLFALTSRLHFLDPALLFLGFAFLTVCLTKILNRIIVTRRYRELEERFNYWVGIREEALRCTDREKGRRMARNIDTSELNRAYYDYFFEGLLLGIARRIIPIFFVFGFINEYYRPEKMLEFFGREHVIQLGGSVDGPILIGSVFWFFFSVLMLYILWAIAARVVGRKGATGNDAKLPAPPPAAA
jgi:hypothetical protein